MTDRTIETAFFKRLRHWLSKLMQRLRGKDSSNFGKGATKEESAKLQQCILKTQQKLTAYYDEWEKMQILGQTSENSSCKEGKPVKLKSLFRDHDIEQDKRAKEIDKSNRVTFHVSKGRASRSISTSGSLFDDTVTDLSENETLRETPRQSIYSANSTTTLESNQHSLERKKAKDDVTDEWRVLGESSTLSNSTVSTPSSVRGFTLKTTAIIEHCENSTKSNDIVGVDGMELQEELLDIHSQYRLQDDVDDQKTIVMDAGYNIEQKGSQSEISEQHYLSNEEQQFVLLEDEEFKHRSAFIRRSKSFDITITPASQTDSVVKSYSLQNVHITLGRCAVLPNEDTDEPNKYLSGSDALQCSMSISRSDQELLINAFEGYVSENSLDGLISSSLSPHKTDIDPEKLLLEYANEDNDNYDENMESENSTYREEKNQRHSDDTLNASEEEDTLESAGREIGQYNSVLLKLQATNEEVMRHEKLQEQQNMLLQQQRTMQQEFKTQLEDLSQQIAKLKQKEDCKSERTSTAEGGNGDVAGPWKSNKNVGNKSTEEWYYGIPSDNQSTQRNSSQLKIPGNIQGYSERKQLSSKYSLDNDQESISPHTSPESTPTCKRRYSSVWDTFNLMNKSITAKSFLNNCPAKRPLGAYIPKKQATSFSDPCTASKLKPMTPQPITNLMEFSKSGQYYEMGRCSSDLTSDPLETSDGSILDGSINGEDVISMSRLTGDVPAISKGTTLPKYSGFQLSKYKAMMSSPPDELQQNTVKLKNNMASERLTPQERMRNVQAAERKAYLDFNYVSDLSSRSKSDERPDMRFSETTGYHLRSQKASFDTDTYLHPMSDTSMSSSIHRNNYNINVPPSPYRDSSSHVGSDAYGPTTCLANRTDMYKPSSLSSLRMADLMNLNQSANSKNPIFSHSTQSMLSSDTPKKSPTESMRDTLNLNPSTFKKSDTSSQLSDSFGLGPLLGSNSSAFSSTLPPYPKGSHLTY